MRVLGTPFLSCPYTWAAYQHPRFVNHVRATLTLGRYDLVHCDNVHVAPAVCGVKARPRVVNAHNVEHILVRRVAQQCSTAKRLFVTWQAKKTLAAERRAYRAFDHCIAVSALDAEEIQDLVLRIPVSVVPNGVDVEYFKPVPVPTDDELMVFTGGLDWFPNRAGVEWFASNVLPRLRASAPRAKLIVVGVRPAESVVSRLGPRGVEFTGVVEDVRPHVGRAGIVVVPLGIASGTRLKILEAWAMGKAVVATSIGAEGLPVRDNQNIAIVDDPAAFAERALALLRDPGARERLGSAGRALVEDVFDWTRVAGRLLDVYEQTVSGRDEPVS